MNTLPPKVGSLFSGAGGLDLAVEAVFGGRTVWHSELDPAASKVLAYRWPGVPNLGDITAIDWGQVEPVDVLCGGFPCQDVSAAGKRAGLADGTRSGLWAVFADAIDTLRPQFVVIENVRGLLSAPAHRNMESDDTVVGDGSDRPVLRAAGAVCGDLADLGYDAQWATVAASGVGAPHRRERVFILAISPDTPRHGRHAWRPEPARIVGRPDAPVSGDGPVDLLPTPAARDFKGHGPSGMDRNSPNMSAIADLLPTPNASDGSGGGQHPDSREGHSRQLIDYALLHGSSQWGKYSPAIQRWEQIHGPAPAPTEPNRNGKPRLSAAFSEWLMGWPAGWVTDPAIGISRNDQLRIIGNGVVPQQAIAALQWLLEVSEAAA